MSEKSSDESYGKGETEQRLQRILQGAFSGPPTPLKDIPKRKGGRRKPKAAKGEGVKKGGRKPP
jgi:hypothetical protein